MEIIPSIRPPPTSTLKAKQKKIEYFFLQGMTLLEAIQSSSARDINFFFIKSYWEEIN